MSEFIPPQDVYVFGFALHLYSLFFVLGIFSAYAIALRLARRLGVDEKVFDRAVLSSLIFGIAGARLFFVAGHWGYFKLHQVEILEIWNGGLAFYGGIGGAALGLWLVYLWRKFSFLNVLDSFALGLPLGQAVGRLGNFFNQEAYGGPTDLPWKIYIEPQHRAVGFESFSHYHPTFLYEGLGLAIIFLVLSFTLKKRYEPGQLVAIYVIASGSLRVLIEFLRLDALVVSGLKISQAAAIVLVIIGLFILRGLRLRKHDRQTV